MKTQVPREAKTLAGIIRMDRDCVETERYWMSVDEGDVCLYEQQYGLPATAKMHIPRKTFEAFIDWYNTGVWKQPKKRKAVRR